MDYFFKHIHAFLLPFKVFLLLKRYYSFLKIKYKDRYCTP
ncbi:hypothetical protein HPHPH18_0771 [Helicobacter pylori Hp H-18]|nr:hypothetical protein HPHPH18_0771 [Helicobacter pylori Hp H-18]